MIQINKTPNADTRTANDEMSKAVLLKNSAEHIKHVNDGCLFFADMLKQAGKDHDHTKIEHIDQFYEDAQSGNFGAAFKAMRWFQIHLTERHHLNDRCPEDVNLIDVLERVIDITMAGLARSGEIYDVDIDPAILVKAYRNTVELLKRNVEVSE